MQAARDFLQGLWGPPSVGVRATLLLQGDASAQGAGVPGFSGAQGPLSLDAKAGETLAAVLERLNTFRSPEFRIVRVWHPDGRPAEGGLRFGAGATLRLVVRAGSLGGLRGSTASPVLVQYTRPGAVWDLTPH